MTLAPSPPPPPLPPGPPPAQPQFDFAKPFTFVFEDPNWIQKILIGGLFYLAGFLLIGWFFVLGYVAQLARNVIAGVQHPLPEWTDLGAFFNDGLRLLGVALVYIVPFVGLAMLVFIPAGILGAIEDEGVQALGGGLAGCLSCLFVPLGLAVLLFMPASMLFAAVEQRFGAAFEFGRIWPFIRGNIGNYLLAIVVYLIARFLGGFGVMIFCIGVIFTAFWAFLVTTHGFAQTYRLSTTR